MEVSPLSYGCAAAYARTLISDETAIMLFQKAYEYGINFFDTGHSYGMAEQRIGMALKASPDIRREDIVISTKFGTRVVDGKYVHDVSPDWIKRSVELSLERMGINYIDVLYVHGPHMEDLSDDKMLDCLDDLKRQGLIRAIGANTFDSNCIDKIAEEKMLDVVMLDYNIVRQDREPQIDKLFENGIGVVAGQAMAESVFLNDLYKIRGKKDIWYLARTMGRKASRELFFKARKYRFLNSIDGYEGSQIALKYVLDNLKVASAAVGTCSFEHLEENVKAFEVKIPDEINRKIKSVK